MAHSWCELCVAWKRQSRGGDLIIVYVEGADLIAGWLAKKWAKDSGAYMRLATWISALLFDHLLSRMAEIHKPRHRKWPRRLSWVARFVTKITPRASCSFRYIAPQGQIICLLPYTPLPAPMQSSRAIRTRQKLTTILLFKYILRLMFIWWGDSHKYLYLCALVRLF